MLAPHFAQETGEKPVGDADRLVGVLDVDVKAHQAAGRVRPRLVASAAHFRFPIWTLHALRHSA